MKVAVSPFKRYQMQEEVIQNKVEDVQIEENVHDEVSNHDVESVEENKYKGEDNMMNLEKNKTSNKKYFIGLDAGFGFTKVISEKGEIMFPSVVAESDKVDTKLLRLRKVDLKKLSVKTDDGRFYVGHFAFAKQKNLTNRTETSNRSVDITSRVLFHTGIALGLPDESGQYRVSLITGLPNKDYETTIKNELERFLKTPFTVTFDLGAGREIVKEIKVENVEIIRQSESASLYNMYMELDGELEYRDENVETLGVIDIGHSTTDFAIFQDGVTITNDVTCGTCLGTKEVYNQLSRMLVDYFVKLGLDYSPSDRDLDTAVREKKIKYAGEEHDISEFLNRAVKNTAPIIAKAVHEAWGEEANRLDKIVLTGGGASLFKDALEEEFSKRRIQKFVVQEENQLSVVRGYAMFQKLKKHLYV